MAFQVYPAGSPLTSFANGATATVAVTEILGTVNNIATMYVTIAVSPAELASAATVINRPIFSLDVGGAGAVVVDSQNGQDPDLLAGGTVWATVYNLSDNVYRMVIFKLVPTPPVLTWGVSVRNENGAEVKVVMVASDTEADGVKPWMDLPATLDWDEELKGAPLITQVVPLACEVGNRGTGPLTLGVATGAIGGSVFEVDSVPGAIAPGRLGNLGLLYNAPATPGADAGVVLDPESDDPAAGAGAPSHPLTTTLSATRGKLEVMLLLDASGSMGYKPDGTLKVSATDTRWAKLTDAAAEFLKLLGDHCAGLGRFGISVFPDITDPAFPPLAPSPSAKHLFPPANISAATIADATTALDVDDPPQPSGGATPMGFGIGYVMGSTAGSYGDYESSASSVAHNQRVMVLMSDGATNSGDHPSVYWKTDEGEAGEEGKAGGCKGFAGTAPNGRSFADKGVRVITLAYGDPAVSAFEVDHELLSRIACKSGGTALDAKADDAGLDFFEVFRDALVDGLALSPIKDPGGVLTESVSSVRRAVQVTSSDETVSFVVDWVTADPGRIRVDLITPICELISTGQDAPDGVIVHRHARFAIITVTDAYLRNTADPARPRYGEWTMIISADLGPVIGRAAFEDSEQYQYAVLTRSRLRLHLSAGSTGYVAGDTIDLNADLRLDGAPVRDAIVQAFLDRPGASAGNWLAAQVVSDEDLATAEADLGDIEATTIGVKTHALIQRGVRFDPLAQSGVLTLPLTGDRYTLALPGNSTPGTSTFRVVATGTLDGVPFTREKRLHVVVGVRPDPKFTLVDIAYTQDIAVVRVWPRDRFGNVLLLDPDTDPTMDIVVAGSEPVTGVVTRNDGSYTKTVRVPAGTPATVTVTIGGVPVIDARPVPPPTGLIFADRLIAYTPGGEAEPGANRNTVAEVVLGDPDQSRDFLALGAGGQVTVGVTGKSVLGSGGDDVNVIVEDSAVRRSYRVQAQQPVTGRWLDLGTSGGVSASFSLRDAELVHTSAVRVIDTSLRTHEDDMSISRAPGAQIAGIGFRKVDTAPRGCLDLVRAFLDWLRGLFQPRGTHG